MLWPFRNKKWSASDVIWAGVFVALGLFLVLVVYLFIQYWKESTLRQLLS